MKDIADRAAQWIVNALLIWCALIVAVGVPVCAWRLFYTLNGETR